MSLPPVAEHLVHLVFPFQFSTSDGSGTRAIISEVRNLTIGDLVEGLPLPQRLVKSLEKSPDRNREPLWMESKSTEQPCSDDFFPHIQQLLRGTAQQDDSSPLISATPWVLSPHAISALSGAFGTRGEGLSVELSRSASRRLGNAQFTRSHFLIEDGYLHLFGTGIGCAVIGVRYQLPHGQDDCTSIILESTAALSRCGARSNEANIVSWVEDSSASEAVTPPLRVSSMESIASALCPFIDRLRAGQRPVRSLNWNRIFTYTAVQLAARVDDERTKRLLAVRLSRKYTADYDPSDEEIGWKIVQPFSYITHAMSIEGGATVVEMQYVETEPGTRTPLPFLNSFSRASIKAYWAVALLALQEFEALLWITQGSVRAINYDDPTPGDLRWLREIQRDLLSFRQLFRFTSVSRISMHNQVYDAWREVLHLDRLLAEATADSSAISQYINRLTDERIVKLNIRQTALGIFFGAAVLFSGLLGMNLKEVQDLSLLSWEVWGITAAIFVGALIGFRRYKIEANSDFGSTRRPSPTLSARRQSTELLR